MNQHIAYQICEQLHINKIYSLFMPSYKNKYNFYGESHNFWETLYVLSGSVCVSANEKVYNLNEGDIVFHEPLELHKFYTTTPNTKLLIFSYDLEGNLSEFFRHKVFNLTKHQKSIISSMIDYFKNASKQPEYINPGRLTHEEWHQYLTPINTNPIYGQSLVIYIYQLMLSLVDNSTRAHSVKSHESILFRSAVNYMTENISNSISVSDIAKNINISISGLKRIFEKYAGMGVHKYFLTLKLNAATELLESGCSVSEVTASLGFSSSSYFSKVYKRELKRSPSHIKLKK